MESKSYKISKDKTNLGSLALLSDDEIEMYHIPMTLAIEEPEVHLHPSFQSKLADMFWEANVNFGTNFIIETHSEYLIRRTQIIVANQKYGTNDVVEKKCPFQAFYVPAHGKPYSLGYRYDGNFKEKFGEGFYDEAANLAFELL